MGIPVMSLLLLAVSPADDWSQFRGPNRDAVWNETGLLESFPPEGLKIRWRAPSGGGFSSPVVAQGRVYLTGSSVEKPRAWEHIRCFDARTGAALWTHTYEVKCAEFWFDPEARGGPNSTPIVHAGKVFNVGSESNLFCLDAERGTVVWSRNLVKDYGLEEHWAITPSPLIEGDLLILAIGGKPNASIVGLDKNSGKEVWRALEDRWTYSSPIVVDAGGKRQLILWTQQGVTSLDPLSGKIYWRETHELRGNYNIVTAPVVHQDLLMVAGMMFRLHADTPAATLLWPETMAASQRVLSFTSMPLIRGEFLYSDRWTGSLVCMEVRTGKEVWKTNAVTAHRSGATIHLIPNGDCVWIFTDQGNLIRARLTPQGYQELGRTQLIEPTYAFAGRKVVWAPPAFADRHVFARNEKELVCASLEAR